MVGPLPDGDCKKTDHAKWHQTQQGFGQECVKTKCDCFTKFKAMVDALQDKGHAMTIQNGGDCFLHNARAAFHRLHLRKVHAAHLEASNLDMSKSVLWNPSKLLSFMIPQVSFTNEIEQQSYSLGSETVKNYTAINYKLLIGYGSLARRRLVQHVYGFASKEGSGSLDFALAWVRVCHRTKRNKKSKDVKTADDWQKHELELGAHKADQEHKRKQKERALKAAAQS
jgi:hypothetical protein